MVPDPERLARIDSDLEALGKTTEELAALRARLPRGSDLGEIDAALADLANGANGTAMRIAMAPAAPRSPRAAPARGPKPDPKVSKSIPGESEGRHTEELIDVEALRVHEAPPAVHVKGTGAGGKSAAPGRRIPTAPPSKRSVPPPPQPAPLPAKPPSAAAPPKPAHPMPPPPSVSTAIVEDEPIEDVRDDELYESPAAAAARGAASGRGLSVDDLFGDQPAEDGPFPDLSGSFTGPDGIADLLQGDAPRAAEGLGPLNLSDELESDMTAVYTGEEMRALGSIPPPSSAADLDAELDAFTASAPPARPSQRPLSVAEFGPDPFADNNAAAAPATEGGDFELLIDDTALAEGADDDFGVELQAQPGAEPDEFPDDVRTSLEGETVEQIEAAAQAAEAPSAEGETEAEGDEPRKKKGFFRKMFGK